MIRKKPPLKPIYPYDPLDDGEPLAQSPVKEDKRRGSNRLMLVVMCLAVATTVCVIVSAAAVFTYLSDLRRARAVNDEMREIAEEYADTGDGGEEARDPAYIAPFDREMRAINPDYICWIKIDGTVIDYPVVRAADNEKYLELDFMNEHNLLGAIFMDYRCRGSNIPHIIIYGHNSREGDMFGGLRHYLEDGYMEEHPVITLNANGRVAEYEIFAARKTDVNDPAYVINFPARADFIRFAEECGAGRDAVQILTLSTCVSGDDPDERVVVQARLVTGG